MRKRLFIQSENTSITLDEMFEKFITFKKMSNVSEETVVFYEDCFRYFGQFYKTNQTWLESFTVVLQGNVLRNLIQQRKDFRDSFYVFIPIDSAVAVIRTIGSGV